MTINLYVTSTQNFSGKSAVCVALMDRLQKDGFKVGYLKPFSSAARVLSESSVDEDARFIKETFGLAEPLETLAPVVLTNWQVNNILDEVGKDMGPAVVKAAKRVGAGKDVVVMEGSANFREGRIVGLSPAQTVGMVDAKVVTVVGYQDNLQVVDDILTARVRMGEERLAGVILNNVPQVAMEYIKTHLIPYMEKQGVSILAVLPYEKRLGSIGISEIAEAINGEVLCGECGDTLVENLLVAAMDVEQALTHFRRVTNKAVIVGGDRPDVQLVALETSTNALILTGNMRPNPMIQARAEEQEVAIIVSPYDTLTTVEHVEKFFGKTRFHQVEKVERFEKLVNEEMDFGKLYEAIGLKK